MFKLYGLSSITRQYETKYFNSNIFYNQCHMVIMLAFRTMSIIDMDNLGLKLLSYGIHGS